MTFAIEKKVVGKKSLETIEPTFDACGLDYGESVTNLVTKSEEFEHSNWVKVNGVTVTANAADAPDGTRTADKIESDGTPDPFIQQTTPTGAALASKTFTEAFYIRIDDGQPTEAQLFLYDLSAGDIVSVVITLTTEWQRFDLSNSFGGVEADTSLLVRIDLTSSPSAGDYLYLWGAQVREGSTPGHYVKTTTASAIKACTATGGSGDECRNTRNTCQDVPNYTKTTATYKMCSKSHMPIGEALYPRIEKISISPAIAEPGKIGVRGTITATLSDFSHHDRGVDPYAATRAYDAMEQGTFFGRLIASNPYYPGRPLKYKKGYIANTFSWSDFESRHYVMDTISGPDARGLVTIKGRDRLILAQDDKVKIPATSVGTLTADITDAATSFTMSTGDGASYGASGTIALGDEDITFTRSGDVFTIVRAANGTKASEHDQDDLVQECKAWITTNVVDVIDEILVDYVGIDETKIPYDAGLDTPTGTPDEWDDLKDIWLTGNNLTRTVREPTGARTLIEELLEQNNLMLWHDQVADKIKLAANVPPLANATLNTYTDEKNFIGLPKVTRDEKRRLTTVIIHWGKIDNSGDEKTRNYRYHDVFVDTGKISADQYDGEQIREIFASWLPSSSLISQLGGRLIARYANTPHVIEFRLDARDSDLMVGDICWVDTRQLQNPDGSNKQEQLQITSRNDDGDPLIYKGLTSTFSGKYGFIAPNTIGSRLTETDENVRRNGFICESNGFFADGEPGDKII